MCRHSVVKISGCALAAVLLIASWPAAADLLVPGEKSELYYKIGGGEPVSRSANPGTVNVVVGLGGTARLNYSCGKFDAGVTIQNLMNSFASLGTSVTAAVRAGIAALPLYIMQRATPGLYELFQTYQKKAELDFNTSLKSCEEMEAVIRKGGDPYDEWLKLAKGEDWKTQMTTTQDVVAAKTAVETTGGDAGMTWIGGTNAGGMAQPAVEVVRNMAQAGYNLTMNVPPATSPTTVYPSTGPSATKLAQTFPTPNHAANWAVAVVGDLQIATCDHPGCPAKASIPGAGLLPQFEAERTTAATQLATAVAGAGLPLRANLEAASAPGVAITTELVDALRSLGPVERQVAMNRIAMEVAQARVIDKALMVRTLLLTGAGLPEAHADVAQKAIRDRVADLNRYIDDLLFETRVRREVVSNTANAVIEQYRADRMQSAGVQTRQAQDQHPLDGGRVQ